MPASVLEQMHHSAQKARSEYLPIFNFNFPCLFHVFKMVDMAGTSTWPAWRCWHFAKNQCTKQLGGLRAHHATPAATAARAADAEPAGDRMPAPKIPEGVVSHYIAFIQCIYGKIVYCLVLKESDCSRALLKLYLCCWTWSSSRKFKCLFVYFYHVVFDIFYWKS